ncbi:hypothetical protein ACH518_05970 [Methylomonas sp. HW2-6]|uniref:hypothetical protein n=1 Tax=Methylomonas sp. HW2-6 TaxID=3376687 RepID=UPI0040431912
MKNGLTASLHIRPNLRDFFYIYLPLLLLSTIIVLNLTAFIDSIRFYPSNDSYYEEAQNFIKGHGLTRTPWAANNYTVDYEPTIYQPPGYGILIYLVTQFGLPPTDADLWISRICWILTPSALVFLLRPLIGLTFSILSAAIIASAPSFYLFSPGPFTEPVYSLLILISLGVTTRSLQYEDKHKSLKLFVLSGFIAGIAYAIRNVGLAYFLSFFSALLVLGALRQESPKKIAKIFGFFLLGLTPIVIALLWRNISLFGEALPYKVNQGYFSTPLISLRVLIEAILLDLSGSRDISMLSWDFLRLISIGLPLATLFAYFCWKHRHSYNLTEKFFILFALLLLTSSSGMLVIAHTYHGLDPGDLIRHVYPFSWIFFPLFLVAFRVKNQGPYYKAVGVAIGTIIIAGHLYFIKSDIEKTEDILNSLNQSTDIVAAAQPVTGKYKILSNEIIFKISRDPIIQNTVSALPGDALLISNVGGALRRVTGRPVRTLDFNARNLDKSLMDVIEMSNSVTTVRPFYFIALPSNDIARAPVSIDWQQKMAEILVPHGFSIAEQHANIIVFSKPKQPNSLANGQETL